MKSNGTQPHSIDFTMSILCDRIYLNQFYEWYETKCAKDLINSICKSSFVILIPKMTIQVSWVSYDLLYQSKRVQLCAQLIQQKITRFESFFSIR